MAKKNKNSEILKNAAEKVNGLFLKKPAVAFKMSGTRKDKKRLIALIDTVAQSSLFAKDVLRKAAEKGYTLSLASQTGSLGFTNGDRKTIMLQPSASDEKLLSTLIHECRHAGQIENGVNAPFFSLNVKSELMVRRAMEADACACAAYGVMQMKENGRLEAYEEYKKRMPVCLTLWKRRKKRVLQKPIYCARGLIAGIKTRTQRRLTKTFIWPTR